jgi:hypothetical protein
VVACAACQVYYEELSVVFGGRGLRPTLSFCAWVRTVKKTKSVCPSNERRRIQKDTVQARIWFPEWAEVLAQSQLNSQPILFIL